MLLFHFRASLKLNSWISPQLVHQEFQGCQLCCPTTVRHWILSLNRGFCLLNLSLPLLYAQGCWQDRIQRSAKVKFIFASLLPPCLEFFFALTQPSSPFHCRCTEDKHPGSVLHAHTAWERGIIQQGPGAAEPASPQRARSSPFREIMCVAPGFT